MTAYWSFVLRMNGTLPLPVDVEFVVDAVISFTETTAVSLAFKPATTTVSVLLAGVPPPPPQLLVHPFGCTVSDDEAVLLARFGSVMSEFWPTTAVSVIVDPAVPAFTVAVICKVTGTLTERLPIVHVPVDDE